jgi:dTDP-4-dehydrorhamnose reductase
MEPGQSGRVLVVGGDSLVGSALQARCRAAGVAFDATSRRPEGDGLRLDLSDPDFAPVMRTGYQSAVICAAITSLQACQKEPQASRRINVDNTLDLMRRLADRGTHLVFLSSSQVFDGETPAPPEEAPTGPRNEYGHQKLAVEQAIDRDGLPAAVLRPTKVLADRPVGTFKGWFDSLLQGKPVQAATNMALSPVMVADVAEASLRLGQSRHLGIWHLGSSDEIGYVDAARLMAQLNGLPAALVTGEPVTEAQVPAIFRHRYVALSCEKVGRSLGLPAKRARDILEVLFSSFPRSAAAP